MKRLCLILSIGAACAACEQARQEPSNQVSETTAAPGNKLEKIDPGAIRPGEPGGLPDDRNLVQEGPINPNSAQGAGQVLQSFATLLEQRRFAEARRLWSDGGRTSGMSEDGFAEAFGKYAEIHAEIGAPGQIEGAAGSAYVEIPVRLYGKLRNGAPFNSTGTATLRRVNDVPGSTEEQRRWRIYRMDMQPPP